MSFRIKIQNSRSDWYQLFPDNEAPKSFMQVMKEQKATFYEDGSFECTIHDIQPVIDSLEDYIKIQQREFNSSRSLRGRLNKRKAEMDSKTAETN